MKKHGSKGMGLEMIRKMVVLSVLMIPGFIPGVCVSAPSPLTDAVAVWNMADGKDSAGKDSVLKTQGDVQFAVQLEGKEREASLKRGGDGFAVRIKPGGYLSAGQGVEGELNLGGKAMTMLIRLNHEGGWISPVMTKHEGGNVVYKIFGTGHELLGEIGCPEVDGFHRVRAWMNDVGRTGWHDVIVRADGRKQQLIVDGSVIDEDPVSGTIRKGNEEPLLLGAETIKDKTNASFKGLIDHAALWNRALTDEEVASLSGVERLGDRQPEYYHEPCRPQFHFTARKHWINDPNGLVFYKGTWHLFFQHWPPGRPPAYKDWGHAVSTDLVQWTQIEPGLVPEPVLGGCWSGSAVVDWENTAGFQSGKEKTIIAILTNGGIPAFEKKNWVRAEEPKCTQCIAYSTDAGRTFTYYDKNPVVPHMVGENRDPKVFWHAPTKKWIMPLYLKATDYRLLSSPDLKTWSQLADLHIQGWVTECPDMFELPVDPPLSKDSGVASGDRKAMKWVFLGGNGGYLVGTFDGKTFTPETKVQMADLGKNFYGSQTWSDVPAADGRRIQIAWMAVGPQSAMMPFTQQLSFPCELTLRTSSNGVQLCRWPVREIETLRGKHHSWKKPECAATPRKLTELSGDLYDITAEIEPGTQGETGFLVNGEKVVYRPAENKLAVCGKDVPLAVKDGKIQLRILVDWTSIEVFGNEGRLSVTSCLNREPAKAGIQVLSTDGGGVIRSLDVWELKSIWPESKASTGK